MFPRNDEPWEDRFELVRGSCEPVRGSCEHVRANLFKFDVFETSTFT